MLISASFVGSFVRSCAVCKVVLDAGTCGAVQLRAQSVTLAREFLLSVHARCGCRRLSTSAVGSRQCYVVGWLVGLCGKVVAFVRRSVEAHAVVRRSVGVRSVVVVRCRSVVVVPFVPLFVVVRLSFGRRCSFVVVVVPSFLRSFVPSFVVVLCLDLNFVSQSSLSSSSLKVSELSR